MTAATVPTAAVAYRAARDLAHIDHLLDLLRRVDAGYRFTNRLGEALLLIPEDVTAEVARVLGLPAGDDSPARVAGPPAPGDWRTHNEGDA